MRAAIKIAFVPWYLIAGATLANHMGAGIPAIAIFSGIAIASPILAFFCALIVHFDEN